MRSQVRSFSQSFNLFITLSNCIHFHFYFINFSRSAVTHINSQLIDRLRRSSAARLCYFGTTWAGMGSPASPASRLSTESCAMPSRA